VARLTPERDALVVRLVYDGLPRAGKTTSLRALADGMARAVFSPPGDARDAGNAGDAGDAGKAGNTGGAGDIGRTLYFDWLEYVGGNFEGIPIRCQIVSVPGQPDLAARRRALLSEADAVVLVVDSLPEHLPAIQAHLGELREILAAQPAPRPGVVVQANQRDRPEACPLAVLNAELGLAGLTVVESVATENRGVRDGFILAVRLALDRARELLRLGSLEAGVGSTDDPDALLAWLQALEGDRPEAEVAESPASAPSSAASTPSTPSTLASAKSRVPRLPDSGAPSGWVWPPVDGRMILHAASAFGAPPRRTRDGSWRCTSTVGLFHSMPRHEFEDLEAGKEALVRWASLHAESLDRLSSQRAIALAETGWGTWRLWQVVRAEESLRQRLQAGLRQASAARAAALLCAAGARLLAARAVFGAPPPLPSQLHLVGEAGERPIYIGLLPPPDWKPGAAERALSGAALVRRELKPLLAPAPGEVEGRPWTAEELLAALRSSATGLAASSGGPEAAEALEALTAILSEDPAES
jgi:hypothetical protein